MKTAMQEFINELEKDVSTQGLAHHAKVTYLEKEKQQIIDAYDEGVTYYEHDSLGLSAEEYFTKTYKQ